MKEVCVVSSYPYIKRFINYGSLFQYYALQYYLKKKGCNVSWLNYDWFKLSRRSRISRLKEWMVSYGKYGKILHVRRSFGTFVKENLETTVYYPHYELLKRFPPKADLYITGSDQVWGRYSDVTFLQFVPAGKKCMAYAASFGKPEYDKTDAGKATKALSGFDKITVREDSAVSLCAQMGVEAEKIIDPTLLLDFCDYPGRTPHDLGNGGIFCYFLNDTNPDKMRWNEILLLSKNTGLNISVSANEYTYKNYQPEYLCYQSPEEWIEAYRSAEYIVTNSFHGTVFAILSKKKFLVIGQNGTFAKQNTRMESLLKGLGLEDRLSNNDIPFAEQIQKKIDWENVYQILNKQREAAYEVIEKSALIEKE